MSTAASAVPRTSAGMSMRLTLATGSSKRGTKPDAGSQPSRTETSRISMIPSQKFGIDTPHSEAALARTSQAVFRRTAAITPAGIASANAIRRARHASSTVIGSVTAEMKARRTRNSVTRLLPARPLDADQTVRDGLVALQVLRERGDVILEVEVDDVAAGEDVIHRLAVEGRALGDIAHLARLVQESIHLLVAGEGLVEASATGVELVDVVVGVDAPAPADEERLVLAVLVVLQRGGELLGRQRDVEPGFARHALDDLADAPPWGIVDDHHLEGVTSRKPGLGE